MVKLVSHLLHLTFHEKASILRKEVGEEEEDNLHFVLKNQERPLIDVKKKSREESANHEQRRGDEEKDQEGES